MKGTHSLGKNERLKSRKAIEELFASGKKISLSFYILYFRFVEAKRQEPLQFGVGVSAKLFRRAIDRNRIKRLTREAYRLQKLPLKNKLKEREKNLDAFFIYTGKELPEYATVKTVVGKLLDKLEGMLN